MNGGEESELARLMRAAIGGDEKAYAEFLRRAACLVRGFARRKIVRGGIDPEDIVQETLLAIHLKRHTWRDDGSVLPWLYAIARYKLIDAFRRQGRRVEIEIDEIAETFAAAGTGNRQRPGDSPRARDARAWPALGRGGGHRRRAFDRRDGRKPRHQRGGSAGCAASRPDGDRQTVRAAMMDTNELIKSLAADARPSGGAAFIRLVARGGRRSRSRRSRVRRDARPETGHRGRGRDAALSLQVRDHHHTCRKRLRRCASLVTAG